MGFWVVMIKNGWGIKWVLLFIVICFFFIIFNKVVWVWGVVWLILLVKRILVNVGLGKNLNL